MPFLKKVVWTLHLNPGGLQKHCMHEHDEVCKSMHGFPGSMIVAQHDADVILSKREMDWALP